MGDAGVGEGERGAVKREKDTVEMLLSLLLSGGVVEHDGFEWALSEDYRICAVPERGSDTGIAVNMGICALKKMADEIGREELWLKMCAMALD